MEAVPRDTHVFGEQETVAAGGCCIPHCGTLIDESLDFCHHLLLINPLPPAPGFAFRLCIVQPETCGLGGVSQSSLSALNFSPMLTGKLRHIVAKHGVVLLCMGAATGGQCCVSCPYVKGI